MSYITAAIAVFSMASSVQGGRKQRKALRRQAKIAKERGQEQQTFNEVAATQAMAIGRINAAEDRRQARLIASRAVAVASAGGATSDIEHLLGDIYGEGAYRAAVSLMNAQNQSAQLLFEGSQAAKYGAAQALSFKGQGNAAQTRSYTAALNTGAKLLGGMDFGQTTAPTAPSGGDSTAFSPRGGQS